jgi:aryl-alcohol dehydrogenase-like predicted oxidoreductase
MALEGLTREGNIRHLRVSNYDVKQMEELAPAGRVETSHSPYHLVRPVAARADFAISARLTHNGLDGLGATIRRFH